MKLPLLLIDDSEGTPLLDVSFPERFEPLIIFYISRERAISDWNFVAPNGVRLGYYCVSEWKDGSFQPVTDWDRIPKLVEACKYNARYTVDKTYIIREDGTKKWLSYCIDSARSDIEDALAIVQSHLSGVLGSQHCDISLLGEESLGLFSDICTFSGDEMLGSGYAMVHQEPNFRIYVSKGNVEL